MTLVQHELKSAHLQRNRKLVSKPK